MQGVYNFIVGTDRRYHNTVDVDGTDLIVNTEITERDYEFVNRVGTVKAVPLAFDSPIESGDEILIHHNVFRKWYDVREKLKESSNWFKDDEFFVYPDQIYAYKRNDKWRALPKYIFVERVKNDDIWDPAEYRTDQGIVLHSNDLLEGYGVSRGTHVYFRPGTQVAIDLDGKRVYRILSNYVYGYQETEEEDSSSS